MSSRQCAYDRHSLERLFTFFRRFGKSARKAVSSQEGQMHVTDAEMESAPAAPSPATQPLPLPLLPEGEVEAGLSGFEEDAPLPDFLTLEELQQRRVKPRNLQLFSERLTQFTRFVQRVRELARATYDHPVALQRRLERDLGELRSLAAAVRDAAATVQRLRAQRSAVRRERAQLRKHLTKLRDEEVREMESVVAVYDKATFARWEKVRHTRKEDALTALLNDVKGKQQAMDNMCVLIQRKKAQLQGQCGDISARVDVAEGVDVKGGADAAPEKRDLTSGSVRTVALRRRRHHERQDAVAAAADAGLGSASASTSARRSAGARPPGAGGEGRGPRVASSTSNLPRVAEGAVCAAPLAHTELHQMRGVLQALFSDLRTGPVVNVEDIDLCTVWPSQAANQQ